MKKLYFSLCYMLMALMTFTSCNSDIDKIYVNGSAAELLGGANGTTFILTQDMASLLAVTIYWDEDGKLYLSDPDVGMPDGLKTDYIQFSNSADFATYNEEVQPSGSFSAQYTVKEFNAIATKAGLEPFVASPLYVRIKTVIGNNIAPKYSNVLELTVTPYELDMSKVSILNKTMDETIGYLYSPNSDGEYAGFMATTTTWANFYIQEGDGSIWGNDGDTGTPFMISTAASKWNCWFPGVKGCNYVKVSTSKKEWSVIYIPTFDMTVGSETVTMVFDASTNQLRGCVTPAADASATLTNTGNYYNVSTGDSEYTDYQFTLVGASDGTIAFTDGAAASNITMPAGQNTLILDLSTMTYSIKAGDQTAGGNDDEWPADPKYAVPTGDNVYMYGWANNALTTVMSTLGKGEALNTFEGFVSAAQWDNFKFLSSDDTSSATIYGSAPVDDTGLHRLFVGSDQWGIWFTEGGYKFIQVDFGKRSWTETLVSKICVVGDFNGWSADANPMTFDSATKTWSAECDLSNMGQYGIKFMINDDWSWCYTDSDADGKMEKGTTEFMPTVTAGKYKVTISLDDANNMTYTFTAL